MSDLEAKMEQGIKEMFDRRGSREYRIYALYMPERNSPIRVISVTAPTPYAAALRWASWNDVPLRDVIDYNDPHRFTAGQWELTLKVFKR